MLKNPLIIGNWKRGMQISPIGGFSQFRGIDPHKVNGVASIERKMIALTTAGTAVEKVNWTIIDNSGTKVYFLDSAGKLFMTSNFSTYSQIQGTGYNATTEGTLANGNGLVYWKGHILRIRNQLVDAYKLSNSTWYYGIMTLEVARAGLNPAFVGQDDIIYIGNGRYLASITEVGIFDASNSATWTFDSIVLTLPQDYIISCISELGDKLMIGSVYSSTQWNSRIADIFPWNRDTTESFSLPIRIASEGINSIINVKNLLYISAGFNGDIYISNGVSVSFYGSIPLDIKERPGGGSLYINVSPDGLDFFGDELLVGAGQNQSGSLNTSNPLGVYGFNEKMIRYLGNISADKDGSDATRIIISSIFTISSNEFFISWTAGSSYGIDYIGPTNARITSYGAYCHTEMYIIGSDFIPSSLDKFDFYLAKKMVSGDGIRLSYRTDNNESFTIIATMDFATHGAVNSWSFPFSIPNLKTIQFKVEMTATSTTTPELITIICQ